MFKNQIRPQGQAHKSGTRQFPAASRAARNLLPCAIAILGVARVLHAADAPVVNPSFVAETALANITTPLPHVADGNGFDTLVLLINTGTVDATYTLQFFNQAGTQVNYQLDPTQSGMTGTIHAGSEAIVRTAGSGPSTNLGWGQLIAPASVTGMLIYQQQASATSLQEGSAPFTMPSSHFFVPFDNVNSAVTSIGFANPSTTQSATVNFTVRYETGGSDTVPQFTMNPMQQIANTVTSIWSNTAGKRGLIEVTSSVPLGLVAFRFQGSAFTLVDTIAPSSAGSTTITSTIAHTADGNNFKSTFILTNSSTVDAPYTLSILGSTGQTENFNFDVASPLSGTVKAGTTLTIDTTGQGSTTTLGWAQLSAPPAVSGIEVFRQTNPGQNEQQATIPISQTTLTHFFLPFDNAGNTTSIALANPSLTATAAISLTFRYVDGTSGTGTLTLAPRNYQASQLAVLFPATGGKAGVAEFTSSTGIAVVEVRFNPTQAFTSLRAVTPASAGGSATLIEQHAIAQSALGIGLASTGMQSQFLIGVSLLFGPNSGCQSLSGGGSYQGGASATAVTVYYDGNCKQPYLATSPSTTSTPNGGSFAIAETATYYTPGGAVMGSLSLNQNVISTNTSLTFNGVGTFTPATGAKTPVQFGAYCFYGASPVIQCMAAIAQDFPVLGMALGGVTPFSVTTTAGNSTSAASFSGSGTIVSGQLGSLSVTNPSPSSLVVTGGTTYGTETASGGTAAFVLFPPPPTAWTVTDAANDQQCQITLTTAANRSLTLTITQISTSATLATATLDQSGSGTITYSDSSTASVTNWTLAN